MERVDFHDNFVPVAKLVTIRNLLVVVVKKDWIMHQLDVNNAFLHGDPDEEMFMKNPQCFSRKEETRVFRLTKSIYGIKHASKNWYQKLTSALLSIGYK